MDEKETKKYEYSFLLSGRLTEQETTALVEKLESLLQESEASVYFRSVPEKIILAYPIAKEKEAYFCYFHAEIEPEKVLEIKDKLRLVSEVLRYLCVTPPPEGKPQNPGSRHLGKEFSEGSVESDREPEKNRVVAEESEIKSEKAEKAEDKTEKTEDKKEEKEIDLETLEHKLEEIENLS